LGRYERVRKISPPPGFDPRPFHPVESRYTVVQEGGIYKFFWGLTYSCSLCQWIRCGLSYRGQTCKGSIQKPFYSLDTDLFVQHLFISQHTVIPWNTQVRYLGLLLDSKLLFTRHLTSVIHKATGVFLQLLPLLARDSTLSIPNKLTLYKLCIRPILTYTAPVWSSTSSYNYHRLQISQSKCLRVIGNFPRRTPIPHLHTTLNVTSFTIWLLTFSTDALPTTTPSSIP